MGSGFLAALGALAAPMTARILIALGFSVFTVSGVAVAWDTVKSAIVSNLSATAQPYLQLAGLGGVWVALGAVLGACTFVVSLWGLTAATRLIGHA